MPTLYYRRPGSIIRRRTSRAGGLCQVLFVAIEDVLVWPVVNPNSGFCEAPNMHVMEAFYQARMPKRGKTEQTRRNDAGPYVETTIEVTIPFLDADNHRILDRLKYHQFALLVKDSEGTTYLIGTKENGATFTFSQDVGKVRKDIPATTGVFTWLSEDRAPIYTGLLATGIQGDVNPED